MDIQKETIIHYAKKISEYCESMGDTCSKCPFFNKGIIFGWCPFELGPYRWKKELEEKHND